MNARRDRPLTVEPMLPSWGAVHRIIGRANALRLPEQVPRKRLLSDAKLRLQGKFRESA